MLLVALVCSVLYAPSGGAQATLTLRTVARVDADAALTLGHIAAVTGDRSIASLPLPATLTRTIGPDRTMNIGVSDIEDVLRAHGIPRARITIRGDCCVLMVRQRASAPLVDETAQLIAELPAAPVGPTVRDHARFRIEQILGMQSDRIELGFEPADADLLARPTSGLTVDVQTTGLGRRTPLRISLYHADGSIETHRVRVDVRLLREVARATKPMPRGKIVGPGDFGVTSEWLGADEPFVEAGVATGKRLRRSVDAGELLSGANVEPPVVIERGDIVIVHVVSGTVVLRQESRAIESGRVGDRIRLEPISGGMEFRARVEAAGRAVIVASRNAGAGSPARSIGESR